MRGLSLGLGLHRPGNKGLLPILDWNFESMAQGEVPSNITFTRSTTATYVGADGLIASAAINVPRLHYDAVSGRKGWLIEGARTNALTYSEQFDNAAWTKTAMTAFGSGSTANAAVAPDGATTMDLLVPTTSNTAHGVLQWVPITGARCYSVWAKDGGYGFPAIRLRSAVGEALTVVFNLGSGAVSQTTNQGTTITAVSSGIENWGGGVYRCWVVATSSASVGGAIDLMNSATPAIDTNGSSAFAGNGTSGTYLWGAQQEAGATFPSSYIPTTTVAVARGADLPVHTLSGANAALLSAQGTMLVEYSWIGTDSSIVRVLASVDGGSAAVRHLLYTSTGDIKGITTDTAAQANPIASATVAVSTPTKAMYTWKVNSFQACNGGSHGTRDMSGTVPAVTAIGIGSPSYLSTQCAFALIHRVRIYSDHIADDATGDRMTS